MVATLSSIENKFRAIKVVGGNGESLAKLTTKVLENMETLVRQYEEGIKDPAWVGNLQATLSADEQLVIHAMYTTFKDVLLTLGND